MRYRIRKANATGRSVPQVKALAENVEEELAKLDLFARRREGVNEGHWCILDYGDVMVHVFQTETRDFYKLEQLWADAPVREYAEEQ